MTKTNQPDAGAHRGFHQMAEAERLLERAEAGR